MGCAASSAGGRHSAKVAPADTRARALADRKVQAEKASELIAQRRRMTPEERAQLDQDPISWADLTNFYVHYDDFVDHYTSKYTVFYFTDVSKLVTDAYLLFVRSLRETVLQEFSSAPLSEHQIGQEVLQRLLNYMPGRNQDESVNLISNYTLLEIGHDGFITRSQFELGWSRIYDRVFTLNADPRSRRELLQRIIKQRRAPSMPRSAKQSYRRKGTDDSAASLAIRLGVKSIPMSSERRAMLKKKPYKWADPETFLAHIDEVWSHYVSSKSSKAHTHDTPKSELQHEDQKETRGSGMRLPELAHLCRDMVQYVMQSAKSKFKSLRICSEGSYEFDQKLSGIYSSLLPGYTATRGISANEKAVGERFASILLNFLDPERKGEIEKDAFMIIFPTIALRLVDYDLLYAHAISPAAGFIFFPMLLPPSSGSSSSDPPLPEILANAIALRDVLLKLNPVESYTQYLTVMAHLGALRPVTASDAISSTSTVSYAQVGANQSCEDRRTAGPGRRISRIKYLADGSSAGQPGATPSALSDHVHGSFSLASISGCGEANFHCLWAPLDNEENKEAEADRIAMLSIFADNRNPQFSLSEASEMEYDRQRSVALAQALALSVNMVHSMPVVYTSINHTINSLKAAFGLATQSSHNMQGKQSKHAKSHKFADDEDEFDYSDEEDHDAVGVLPDRFNKVVHETTIPASNNKPYNSLTDVVTPATSHRSELAMSSSVANPPSHTTESDSRGVFLMDMDMQSSSYHRSRPIPLNTNNPISAATTSPRHSETHLSAPPTPISATHSDHAPIRRSFTTQIGSASNDPSMSALTIQAATARSKSRGRAGSHTSPTAGLVPSTSSQSLAASTTLGSSSTLAAVVTEAAPLSTSTPSPVEEVATPDAPTTSEDAKQSNQITDPLSALRYQPTDNTASDLGAEISITLGLLSELGLAFTPVGTVLDSTTLNRPPFAKLHAALTALDAQSRARTSSVPLFHLATGETVSEALFPVDPATTLLAKEAKSARTAAATKWIDYVRTHQELSPKLSQCCAPFATTTSAKIASNMMTGQQVLITLKLIQATLLLYALGN